MVNTLFKSKVSRKASQPSQEERIPKTVQLQSVTHGKVTDVPTKPWERQGMAGGGGGWDGRDSHLGPLLLLNARIPLTPQLLRRRG